jgi:NDP-sugar pyrophosphorylase family protein
MKALVLAGGSGSRLRPITHTSDKQLLPVANKSVLFYGLETLRDAGISKAGIIVGDTAPAIRAMIGDGGAFDLDVTYIRQEASYRSTARKFPARLPAVSISRLDAITMTRLAPRAATSCSRWRWPRRSRS